MQVGLILTPVIFLRRIPRLLSFMRSLHLVPSATLTDSLFSRGFKS